MVSLIPHTLLDYVFILASMHDLINECRYSSRQAYAHTSAVMSMVGYVLGLGDRHGENILFDSTNGDCVHVDFNCLFNRVCRSFIDYPVILYGVAYAGIVF